MSHRLLSRPCLRFVFFVERWLFSLLFLYLGYEYLDTLRLMHLLVTTRDLLPPALVAHDAGFIDGIHFEDFARYVLLALSNLTCGLLLLIARKPARYPSRVREVVVPLAATFFCLLFNLRLPLPHWLTTPLIPAAWTTPLAALGLGVSALGVAFSLVGILCLGRSLGIVVSARRVVLRGPYRYVRHPIYLSYLLVDFGLLLTGCTVHLTLLVTGSFAVLCWRARLEENLLAAHSPAYRAAMQHTGFLWPRWPVPAAPAPRRVAAPARRPVLSSIPELVGTS